MPQEMTQQQFYNMINSMPNLPGFDKIKNQLLTQYQQAKSSSIEDKANKRYDEITNFGSDYYKQFQSYLEKLNPQISANSLLAPLTGSGFNYGTSQKIATERAQQMNTKRTEAISKGVQEFAIGSQGQAGGLLQMLFGNNQFEQELAEKQRQFDESSPTFLDSLLNIGGSLLGQFTGGLLGGGSASSARGSSGLASENGWDTYENWRK